MRLSPAEKVAAFLIAPDAAPLPSADEMPAAREFQELVLLHKLPLDEIIAFNKLADHPILKDPGVQSALEGDRLRHRDQVKEFVAVRERLDAAGIPHVLVKGVWGFPYRSDNVDLLVPSREKDRVDSILTDLGYIYNRFRPDRLKRLYVLIRGSRHIITVHTHDLVGWYSPFVEEEMLFGSAVDGAEAGVRLPRREIAMAVNAVHSVYEDATVRLIEQHKIRCLMKQGPIDWDWLWQFAAHRGWESGLALGLLILDRQYRMLTGRPLFGEAVLQRMQENLSRADGTRQHYNRRIADREVPIYYQLSKYFIRCCMFRQVKRSRLVSAWEKIVITSVILRQGVRQVLGWPERHRMLVAMCGADGSGKTMHIESLIRVMEVFEIRAERSWTRIGDSPVLNLLKSPFRRRVRAEADVGQSSEQGRFRNPWVRRLWPPVALADYVIRQYLAVGWAYLRRRVVIADRYHVDALVDLALRCGPEIMHKRWVVWVLRRLPRARPAFVMECSAETLHRRRGVEFVVGVSERGVDYYREAARLFDARVFWNEGDSDVVTEQIAREAVEQYFRRM